MAKKIATRRRETVERINQYITHLAGNNAGSADTVVLLRSAVRAITGDEKVCDRTLNHLALALQNVYQLGQDNSRNSARAL